MEDAQRGSEALFRTLQAGDVEGLGLLLEQDPAAAETRDAKRREPGHAFHLSRPPRPGGTDREQEESARHFRSRRARPARSAQTMPQREFRESQQVSRPSVNSYSKDGFTALHFACFFGQPAAARLLIENGAGVDAVAANPTQVMPLHSAASARNLEAARLLLEHGSAEMVNARQQGGWVPIHAAAQNGDRAMVELLLKHHADPKLTNNDGKTPAMVAREKGHEEMAALLEEYRSSVGTSSAVQLRVGSNQLTSKT